MLKPEVQLISVDDHVIEHPRVWTDRVAESLLDRAPKVIDNYLLPTATDIPAIDSTTSTPCRSIPTSTSGERERAG